MREEWEFEIAGRHYFCPVYFVLTGSALGKIKEVYKFLHFTDQIMFSPQT